MQLPKHTSIDRYIVEATLGAGGMAVVYQVRHSILGTTHALKVLKSPSDELRQRLIREGRLQAQLDPRYVLPVTDLMVIGESPALLMPLVRGCSLREALGIHRLQDHEIGPILFAVAAGIRSAHRVGVIHRDLKPANIMLEVEHGRLVARVADFGIARDDLDSELTENKAMMGTLAYAAPEQLEDAATVDHRADLWSLGVIAYELVTGRRLFSSPPGARGPAALLRQVLSGHVDLQGVDSHWAPLIQGLVQRDRRDRWESATEVCTWLQRHGVRKLSSGNSKLVTEVQRIASGRDPAGSPDGPTSVFRRPSDAAPTRDPKTKTVPKAASPIVTPTPLPPDPFVGRDKILKRLHAMLESNARVVSVLGIGGSGKTRLVKEFTRSTSLKPKGGVWFCDLTDAHDLPATCATVSRSLRLGALRSNDPITEVGEALATLGPAVVVLDNFEQLTSIAEETIERWLTLAPEIRFIITSREVLGLEAECALPLPPLSVEEAVELFLIRARHYHADLNLPDHEIVAARRLVELLDRLPLAIELAAARARIMAPSAMITRMDRRFQLLRTTGRRKDRQATIRGTLDWSWEMLTEAEASTCAQLSVFEGTFDLKAVEAVVDLSTFSDPPWVMDTLQSLVEKSLVQRVADDRFRMLLTVQAYAREQLEQSGSSERASSNHVQYFATFGTTEALENLATHGGIARIHHLLANKQNIEMACRRAIRATDPTQATLNARALWAILQTTGPLRLAEDLAEKIIELPGISLIDTSWLLAILARLHSRQGNNHDALALMKEAIASAEQAQDDKAVVVHQVFLCGMYLREGALKLARDCIKQTKKICRSGGFEFPLFLVELYEADLHQKLGELERSIRAYRSAIARAKNVGAIRNQAVAHGNLGNVLHLDNQLGKAEQEYRRAAVIHEQCGNIDGQMTTYFNLGKLAWADGRAEEAEELWQCIIRDFTGINDLISGYAAGGLAVLHAARGEPQGAARYLDIAKSFDRPSDPIQASLWYSLHAADVAHRLGESQSARKKLAAFLKLRARWSGADQEMQQYCSNLQTRLGGT